MIRVNCLAINCGKCCYDTEMPLTMEDVERILSLGFEVDDFSIVVDGVRRLRNVGGRCFFLENNRCTIYEHRPKGCRIYPLVLNEKGEVVVDDVCPLKEEVEKEITEEFVKKVKQALEKIVKEVYG
ncbi:MAG: YkgJ family cysteine cluster protein [Archaeoglobus sp.]|nr:YkgJ family cysteine cluster protein [Archaeoglobus sp.]